MVTDSIDQFLLGAWVILLTCAPLPVRASDAIAAYNAGNGSARAGRHAEAVAWYDRSIALDPEYAPAWINRGIARSQIGQREAALADFDRALALNPSDPEVRYNRAVTLIAMQRLDEAARSLDDALRLDPRHLNALYNRAFIRLRQGRHAASLPDLDEAIRIDPRFAKAHSSRSLALIALGRYDEALAEAAAAIRLLPEDAEGWLARAQTLMHLNQFVEAVPDYARGLELDPGNTATRANLGLALLMLERGEEAVAALDRALENGGGAALYHTRGQAHLAAGNARAALRDFDTALRLDPSLTAALLYRGVAYRNLGFLRYGCEDLTAALERKPDTALAALAYQSLGYAEFLRGRYREATAAFSEASTRYASGATEAGYSDLFASWASIRSDSSSALPARFVLDASITSLRANQWPRPVAEYVLERITEDELLSAARKAGKEMEALVMLAIEETTSDRSCPGTFAHLSRAIEAAANRPPDIMRALAGYELRWLEARDRPDSSDRESRFSDWPPR